MDGGRDNSMQRKRRICFISYKLSAQLRFWQKTLEISHSYTHPSHQTPPAATSPTLAPLASALFALQSPTPGLSAQASANTLIYLMQPPDTGTTSGAYMPSPSIGFPPLAHTLPGTRPSPRAYIQLSCIGYTPASHAIPAPHTTYANYNKLANHTQLSNTGPTYIVQNPPTAISLPAAIITTSMGHGRE